MFLSNCGIGEILGTKRCFWLRKLPAPRGEIFIEHGCPTFFEAPEERQVRCSQGIDCAPTELKLFF